MGKTCILQVRNDGPDIFKFNLTSCHLDNMRVELFLREDGPYDFIYEGTSVGTCEQNRVIKVPKQEELFIVLIPEESGNSFTVDISPIFSQESMFSFELIIGIIIAVAIFLM